MGKTRALIHHKGQAVQSWWPSLAKDLQTKLFSVGVVSRRGAVHPSKIVIVWRLNRKGGLQAKSMGLSKVRLIFIDWIGVDSILNGAVPEIFFFQHDEEASLV